MSNFIYISNPAKIRDFLEKIKDVGVPEKLTIKHLESMGFKSTNDRPIINIMKELGFVSSSSQPQQRWLDYRNKNLSSKILAEAVKEHYSELYQLYPDAHLKDNEAIRNFFSTRTKVSSSTLDFMVRTFKTIVDLSDFRDVEVQTIVGKDTVVEPSVDPSIQLKKLKGSGITININIQLTLPEGSDGKTFDEFFQSMKKHLLD